LAWFDFVSTKVLTIEVIMAGVDKPFLKWRLNDLIFDSQQNLYFMIKGRADYMSLLEKFIA
jgi:hypothetical protein